jgi:hypothetical protein
MRSFLVGLAGAAIFALSQPAVYAAHAFLCTDSYGGRVAFVASDGKIEWEHRCEHPQDCWILANGHFLFCHKGGALEMTRDHQTVWEYKAPAAAEVHACQPLPDGNVLVVECGPSCLVEVDRAGHIAKTIALTPPPASVGRHDQFRGVRKTTAGHYLVCRKGEHCIEELDAKGTSLRRVPVPGDVHEVVVLPDGHWLVDCGDGHRVQELDQNLQVVWELTENELPGNPLRLVAGCQRLPNGNTLFCNYLGHGHLRQQPHVFEVTRDKKVVWTFADHEHFNTVNQIQVVDAPGDPAKGEILR